MAQVGNLNTISAGNVATAAEIQENFDALKAGINSIDSTQLAASAVTAAAIADLAITTAKIAVDAVTAAKIAAGAVGASEIAAEVVNRDHIDETSLQVIQYVGADSLAVVTGITTDITLSGFDSTDATKFPSITVYWYDTLVNQWRALESGGSETTITFQCLWASPGSTDFVVRINQTKAATLDVRVSAIGLKA